MLKKVSINIHGEKPKLSSLGWTIASSVIALWLMGGLSGPLKGIYYYLPLAIIAMVALWGGILMGFLSMTLISAGCLLLFYEPKALFHISEPHEYLQYFGFLVVASLSVIVAGTHRRMREELAKEIQFQTLAAVLPLLVVSLRPKQAADYVNKQWVNFTGHDLEATNRLGWTSLIHPEDLRQMEGILKEATHSPFLCQLELRLRDKAGLYRWFLVTLNPLLDAFGRIHHYIIGATDIHQRKSDEQTLEKHAERVRRILRGSPIGTLLCDVKGKIFDANRAFLNLLDISREQLKAEDLHCEELSPEEYRELDQRAMREAIEQGISTSYEKECVKKDGQRLKVQCSFASLNENELAGFIMDISSYKEAEQKLREANLQLEEADRRKDEFLALLSHELRNPLMPIMNALFIIERLEVGDTKAKQFLEMIGRQARHMTRLIDDLLDIARISKGIIQLRLENVELNALARQLIDDLGGLFSKNQIRLEFNPAPHPLVVRGDRARLFQVVGNLMQNAAKFTPAGGSTMVTLQRDEVSKEAVICVRDTGVGIAAEFLPQMFEPFRQDKRNLVQSNGGLGLGLALVKGLTELHRGRVTVESDHLHHGAEFSIHLPLELGPHPQEQVNLPATTAPASMHVLLIEDNQDIADTLKIALQFNGHQVEIAHTGSDGFAKAMEFAPTIIVCDIGLPGMDGYEVAHKVRATPRLRKVPMIALSGYAQKADIVRAKEAGFDRHLAKPIDLHALEKVMQELCAL